MQPQERISPWPDESPNPWQWPTAADPRGGEPYARHIAAVRGLVAALAGAVLPEPVMNRVTAEMVGLTASIAAYQRSERQRLDGMRPDLPGRGHLLLPPYVIEEQTGAGLHGGVRFARHHLGGNGAVHGGALPLVFDDLLGKVANHGRDGVARTAFLHVDYRRITPIDADLRFDVTLDRIDGRKRWTTGRLRDVDGAVLAEAEGLFVELRPGQL